MLLSASAGAYGVELAGGDNGSDLCPPLPTQLPIGSAGLLSPDAESVSGPCSLLPGLLHDVGDGLLRAGSDDMLPAVSSLLPLLIEPGSTEPVPPVSILSVMMVATELEKKLLCSSYTSMLVKTLQMMI